MFWICRLFFATLDLLICLVSHSIAPQYNTKNGQIEYCQTAWRERAVSTLFMLWDQQCWWNIYYVRPFFILGKSLFQNFTMLSTSDAIMQAVDLIQYIVLALLYKTCSRNIVSQTKQIVFFKICNVHLSLKLPWHISQTWPRLTERIFFVDIYDIIFEYGK